MSETRGIPNPQQTQRAPCQTCDAYGGPADAHGSTICRRPQDSRKKVCCVPEGCVRVLAADEGPAAARCGARDES